MIDLRPEAIRDDLCRRFSGTDPINPSQCRVVWSNSTMGPSIKMHVFLGVGGGESRIMETIDTDYQGISAEIIRWG